MTPRPRATPTADQSHREVGSIENDWSLLCPRCGFRSKPTVYAHGCPTCLSEGITQGLVVSYEHNVSRNVPSAHRAAQGVWQAEAQLPAIGESFKRTLGEGNTPLIQVPRLINVQGCERLFLKVEAANPTGAHKDRFHAVSLAVGRALGYTGVVSSSTGNHGLSMACYAASHGMRAVVLCNERMPPLLQQAIRFAGGLPIQLPPAESAVLLNKLVVSGEWYPSTTSWPMPVSNPFGVEGYKTISYEIYHQLGKQLPDLIFTPTAGGDSLVGVWRGINDLHQMGIAQKTPHLCACQPTGAAPLVNALATDASEVSPLPYAYSRALSIGDPMSGGFALQAVRATRGFGVAISDAEIEATGRMLASTGLLVEPASAASVAGAVQVVRANPALRGRTIVCIVTSSGLKWLDSYDSPSTDGMAVRIETAREGRRVIDAFLAS